MEHCGLNKRIVKITSPFFHTSLYWLVSAEVEHTLRTSVLKGDGPRRLAVALLPQERHAANRASQNMRTGEENP